MINLNKLKIAAIVVVAVVGIVLYKNRFDKNERAKEDEKETKRSSRRDDLN